MILSLALKNLRAKPLRTVCAVLVIAVAVAMFFCVFSFGDAVYDYIYAVETADAGASDVLIAGKSGGNRLTSAAPLDALGDKIDYAVPTLSLYALASAPTGEQYVKLRGFEQGDWEKLQKINFAEGSAEDLSGERNANSVVISVAASQALGVGRGERLVLNGKVFFVAAIAENDGYFVSDAPFTVIGNVDGGVDRLLGGVSVYNEIYVKAADGADVAALIDEIAALEAYDGLSVTVAADTGYVATRADGVSAPVTISGVAVIALSLIAVALIFLLSTDYKRSYAARLSVLGATKRQIVAVFQRTVSLCGVGSRSGRRLCGFALSHIPCFPRYRKRKPVGCPRRKRQGISRRGSAYGGHRCRAACRESGSARKGSAVNRKYVAGDCGDCRVGALRGARYFGAGETQSFSRGYDGGLRRPA